ncbi:MAG: flagellar basal body P-ring formation chaperone FlgA, partial [Candidatus Margulisiibacteriota bacterium]
SKDQVAGKVASIMIQKGIVLVDWMVKDDPVVSKGSEVKIVVKSDNILIESQGTAMTDGQLNDIISVRRADSHEQIQAKVISPDTVEVQL